MTFKAMAGATALLFALTNVLVRPSYGLDHVQAVKNTFTPTAGPEVPRELGRIETEFIGVKGKAFVVLVEDAHAIWDAQKNIESLIRYFSETYGTSLVALEGTAGKLDPTLFRAFPDDAIRRKVLESYLRKGELSGADLAAVFNPVKGGFYGLEDWPLYEANYVSYLKAMENRDLILGEMKRVKDKFDQERKKIYSGALNEFHERVEAFRDERSNLMELVIFLRNQVGRKTQAGRRYPTLGKLIKSVDREAKWDAEALGVSIRQLAESLRKDILPKLDKTEAQAFGAAFQGYLTGKQDAPAFLAHLVRWGEAAQAPVPLTPAMRSLLRHSEKLSEIKGTKLFDELESFLKEAEDALIQTDAERALAGRYKKVRRIRNLASLEVTRQELEDYRQRENEYRALLEEPGKLEAALEFYDRALERDRALFRNLERIISREKAGSAVVVAGGFHSQGLTEILRREGYSYAVVIPSIRSLEGRDQYEKVMGGRLSYKPYLKSTFYDAFVRDSTLRMSSELGANEFRKVLKVWRDDLVRELAREKRIAEARNYTRYVDLLDEVFVKKFGRLAFRGIPKEKIIRSLETEIHTFRDSVFDKLGKRLARELGKVTTAMRQWGGRRDLETETLRSLLSGSQGGARSSLIQLAHVALTPGVPADLMRRFVLGELSREELTARIEEVLRSSGYRRIGAQDLRAALEKEAGKVKRPSPEISRLPEVDRAVQVLEAAASAGEKLPAGTAVESARAAAAQSIVGGVLDAVVEKVPRDQLKEMARPGIARSLLEKMGSRAPDLEPGRPAQSLGAQRRRPSYKRRVTKEEGSNPYVELERLVARDRKMAEALRDILKQDLSTDDAELRAKIDERIRELRWQEKISADLVLEMTDQPSEVERHLTYLLERAEGSSLGGEAAGGVSQSLGTAPVLERRPQALKGARRTRTEDRGRRRDKRTAGELRVRKQKIEILESERDALFARLESLKRMQAERLSPDLRGKRVTPENLLAFLEYRSRAQSAHEVLPGEVDAKVYFNSDGFPIPIAGEIYAGGPEDPDARALSPREVERAYGLKVPGRGRGVEGPMKVSLKTIPGQGRVFDLEQDMTVLISKEGKIKGGYFGRLTGEELPDYRRGDRIEYGTMLEFKGVGTRAVRGTWINQGELKPDGFRRRIEGRVTPEREEQMEKMLADMPVGRTTHFEIEGEDYNVRKNEDGSFTLFQWKVPVWLERLKKDQGAALAGLFMGLIYQSLATMPPGASGFRHEKEGQEIQETLLASGSEWLTLPLHTVPWDRNEFFAMTLRVRKGGRVRMNAIDKAIHSQGADKLKHRKRIARRLEETKDLFFYNLGVNTRSFLFGGYVVPPKFHAFKDIDPYGYVGDPGELLPVRQGPEGDLDRKSHISKWVEGLLEAYHSLKEGDRDSLFANYLGAIFGNETEARRAALQMQDALRELRKEGRVESKEMADAAADVIYRIWISRSENARRKNYHPPDVPLGPVPWSLEQEMNQLAQELKDLDAEIESERGVLTLRTKRVGTAEMEDIVYSFLNAPGEDSKSMPDPSRLARGSTRDVIKGSEIGGPLWSATLGVAQSLGQELDRTDEVAMSIAGDKGRSGRRAPLHLELFEDPGISWEAKWAALRQRLEEAVRKAHHRFPRFKGVILRNVKPGEPFQAVLYTTILDHYAGTQKDFSFTIRIEKYFESQFPALREKIDVPPIRRNVERLVGNAGITSLSDRQKLKEWIPDPASMDRVIAVPEETPFIQAVAEAPSADAIIPSRYEQKLIDEREARRRFWQDAKVAAKKRREEDPIFREMMERKLEMEVPGPLDVEAILKGKGLPRSTNSYRRQLDPERAKIPEDMIRDGYVYLFRGDYPGRESRGIFSDTYKRWNVTLDQELQAQKGIEPLSHFNFEAKTNLETEMWQHALGGRGPLVGATTELSIARKHPDYGNVPNRVYVLKVPLKRVFRSYANRAVVESLGGGEEEYLIPDYVKPTEIIDVLDLSRGYYPRLYTTQDYLREHRIGASLGAEGAETPTEELGIRELLVLPLEFSAADWKGLPWSRANAMIFKRYAEEFLRDQATLADLTRTLELDPARDWKLTLRVVGKPKMGNNRTVLKLEALAESAKESRRKTFALKLATPFAVVGMDQRQMEAEGRIAATFSAEPLFQKHFAQNLCFKAYLPDEDLRGEIRSALGAMADLFYAMNPDFGIFFQLDQWKEGEPLESFISSIMSSELGEAQKRALVRKALSKAVQVLLKTWGELRIDENGLAYDVGAGDVLISSPEGITDLAQLVDLSVPVFIDPDGGSHIGDVFSVWKSLDDLLAAGNWRAANLVSLKPDELFEAVLEAVGREKGIEFLRAIAQNPERARQAQGDYLSLTFKGDLTRAISTFLATIDAQVKDSQSAAGSLGVDDEILSRRRDPSGEVRKLAGEMADRFLERHPDWLPLRERLIDVARLVGDEKLFQKLAEVYEAIQRGDIQQQDLDDLIDAVEASGDEAQEMFRDPSSLMMRAWSLRSKEVGSTRVLAAEPTIGSFTRAVLALPFEMAVFPSQGKWLVRRGDENSVGFKTEEVWDITSKGLAIHNHPRPSPALPSPADLLLLKEGGMGIIVMHPGIEGMAPFVSLYSTPKINPETGKPFENEDEMRKLFKKAEADYLEEMERVLGKQAGALVANFKEVQAKIVKIVSRYLEKLQVPVYLGQLEGEDENLTLTQFVAKYKSRMKTADASSLGSLFTAEDVPGKAGASGAGGGRAAPKGVASPKNIERSSRLRAFRSPRARRRGFAAPAGGPLTYQRDGLLLREETSASLGQADQAKGEGKLKSQAASSEALRGIASLEDLKELDQDYGFDQQPYLLTNDENPSETIDKLQAFARHHSAVHIGFSGWFNLDIIAARLSKIGILLDINNRVPELFDLVEKLAAGAETREAFVESITEAIRSRGEYFMRRRNLIGIQRELNRRGSWLATDDSYAYIRKMFLEGHIIRFRMDLRNVAGFRTIREWMDKNGYGLDTFYVSNIPQWIIEYENAKGWKEWVESVFVVANPDSLLIDSYYMADSIQRITRVAENPGFDLRNPLADSDIPDRGPGSYTAGTAPLLATAGGNLTALEASSLGSSLTDPSGDSELSSAEVSDEGGVQFVVNREGLDDEGYRLIESALAEAIQTMTGEERDYLLTEQKAREKGRQALVVSLFDDPGNLFPESHQTGQIRINRSIFHEGVSAEARRKLLKLSLAYELRRESLAEERLFLQKSGRASEAETGRMTGTEIAARLDESAAGWVRSEQFESLIDTAVEGGLAYVDLVPLMDGGFLDPGSAFVQGLRFHGDPKLRQRHKDFLERHDLENHLIDGSDSEFAETYVEVRGILARLLRAAGLDPRHYRFYLSDQSDANAFYLGGSNAFVMNLGLLRLLSEDGKIAFSKDAIAFVLAHEIQHLIQHREDVIDGKVNRDMELVPNWSSILESRKEVYKKEYDADWKALKVMSEAGFNVREAPRVFRALLEKLREKGKDRSLYLPFGDHPDLEPRVLELEGLVRERFWKHSSLASRVERFPDGLGVPASSFRAFQKRVFGISSDAEFATVVKDAKDLRELLVAIAVGTRKRQSVEYKHSLEASDVKGKAWLEIHRAMAEVREHRLGRRSEQETEDEYRERESNLLPRLRQEIPGYWKATEEQASPDKLSHRFVFQRMGEGKPLKLFEGTDDEIRSDRLDSGEMWWVRGKPYLVLSSRLTADDKVRVLGLEEGDQVSEIPASEIPGSYAFKVAGSASDAWPEPVSLMQALSDRVDLLIEKNPAKRAQLSFYREVLSNHLHHSRVLSKRTIRMEKREQVKAAESKGRGYEVIEVGVRVAVAQPEEFDPFVARFSTQALLLALEGLAPLLIRLDQAAEEDEKAYEDLRATLAGGEGRDFSIRGGDLAEFIDAVTREIVKRVSRGEEPADIYPKLISALDKVDEGQQNKVAHTIGNVKLRLFDSLIDPFKDPSRTLSPEEVESILSLLGQLDFLRGVYRSALGKKEQLLEQAIGEIADLLYRIYSDPIHQPVILSFFKNHPTGSGWRVREGMVEEKFISRLLEDGNRSLREKLEALAALGRGENRHLIYRSLFPEKEDPKVSPSQEPDFLSARDEFVQRTIAEIVRREPALAALHHASLTLKRLVVRIFLKWQEVSKDLVFELFDPASGKPLLAGDELKLLRDYIGENDSLLDRDSLIVMSRGFDDVVAFSHDRLVYLFIDLAEFLTARGRKDVLKQLLQDLKNAESDPSSLKNQDLRRLRTYSMFFDELIKRDVDGYGNAFRVLMLGDDKKPYPQQGYGVEDMTRMKARIPWRFGRWDMMQEGDKDALGFFGFALEIFGAKTFQEAASEIEKAIPQGFFRDILLYALFVEKVLKTKAGLQVPSDQIFDFEALKRRIAGKEALIREDLQSLVSLLAWDRTIQKMNGQFLLERARVTQPVDQVLMELRQKGELGDFSEDIRFYDLGGKESQLALTLAGLDDPYLQDYLSSDRNSLDEKLSIMKKYYPHPSAARDRYLADLIESTLGAVSSGGLGFDDPLRKSFVAILGLMQNVAMKEQYALRILERGVEALERTIGTLRKDDELREIILFMPDFSLARDEVLGRWVERQVRKDKDYDLARDLFVQNPDNIRKPGGSDYIFWRDQIQQLVFNLDAEEKGKFMLWMMGMGEKPEYLVRQENRLHISFDGLKEDFGIHAGKFYPGVGRKNQEAFFKSLMLGKNGLFQDRNVYDKFLDDLVSRVLPSGKGALRKLVKGVLTSKDSVRSQRILMRFLRRYGELGDIEDAEAKEAASIRIFLESVGFIGVKLGQFLAHSAFVRKGSVLQKELEKLKDSAESFDRAVALDMLEKIYGARVFEDTIESLDEVLGSASIKVVYRATLRDGRTVVLKFKRPEIDKEVEGDLNFLEDLLGRFAADLDAEGIPVPGGLVERLKGIIGEELDFDREAKNQREIGANLKIRQSRDLEGMIYEFSVPNSTEVYEDSLMVEDFAEGVPLAKEDLLRELGIDPKMVRELLLEELLKELFIDGFYHADLHSGNVLVSHKDGKVTIHIIDLGAAAPISPGNRALLIGMLVALWRKDEASLWQYFPHLAGNEKISDSAREILASGINPVSQLMSLFSLLERNNIEIDPEFYSVFRFLKASEYLFPQDEAGFEALLNKYLPGGLADLKQAVGAVTTGVREKIQSIAPPDVKQDDTGGLTIRIELASIRKAAEVLSTLAENSYWSMVAGRYPGLNDLRTLLAAGLDVLVERGRDIELRLSEEEKKIYDRVLSVAGDIFAMTSTGQVDVLRIPQILLGIQEIAGAQDAIIALLRYKAKELGIDEAELVARVRVFAGEEAAARLEGALRGQPVGSSLGGEVPKDLLLSQLAAEKSFEGRLDLARKLGLDTRPTEFGFVDAAYVGHAMAVREIVNPANEKRVGVYGGAGAGWPYFVLSTNADEAYFVEQMPVDIGELNEWLDRWDELSIPMDDKNPFDPGRLRRLYGYGATGAFYIEGFEKTILLGLKAMGVERYKKDGSENIAINRNEDGSITLNFDWAYLGAESKPYSITYFNAHFTQPKAYPQALRDVLDRGIDFYYQKGALTVPRDYAKFLAEIAASVNTGGYLITDDNYTDVVKNQSGTVNPDDLLAAHPGTRFTLDNQISSPEMERYGNLITTLRTGTYFTSGAPVDQLRYGWGVVIRKKLDRGVSEHGGPDSEAAGNASSLGYRADSGVNVLSAAARAGAWSTSPTAPLPIGAASKLQIPSKQAKTDPFDSPLPVEQQDYDNQRYRNNAIRNKSSQWLSSVAHEQSGNQSAETQIDPVNSNFDQILALSSGKHEIKHTIGLLNSQDNIAVSEIRNASGSSLGRSKKEDRAAGRPRHEPKLKAEGLFGYPENWELASEIAHIPADETSTRTFLVVLGEVQRHSRRPRTHQQNNLAIEMGLGVDVLEPQVEWASQILTIKGYVTNNSGFNWYYETRLISPDAPKISWHSIDKWIRVPTPQEILIIESVPGARYDVFENGVFVNSEGKTLAEVKAVFDEVARRLPDHGGWLRDRFLRFEEALLEDNRHLVMKRELRFDQEYYGTRESYLKRLVASMQERKETEAQGVVSLSQEIVNAQYDKQRVDPDFVRDQFRNAITSGKIVILEAADVFDDEFGIPKRIGEILMQKGKELELAGESLTVHPGFRLAFFLNEAETKVLQERFGSETKIPEFDFPQHGIDKGWEVAHKLLNTRYWESRRKKPTREIDAIKGVPHDPALKAVVDRYHRGNASEKELVAALRLAFQKALQTDAAKEAFGRVLRLMFPGIRRRGTGTVAQSLGEQDPLVREVRKALERSSRWKRLAQALTKEHLQALEQLIGDPDRAEELLKPLPIDFKNLGLSKPNQFERFKADIKKLKVDAARDLGKARADDLPPPLRENYPLTPDFASVSRALQDLIDWVLARGNTRREILELYREGLRTRAREMPPEAAAKGVLFSKFFHATQPEEDRIQIYSAALYRVMLNARRSGRDPFIEDLVARVVREAWGWWFGERIESIEDRAQLGIKMDAFLKKNPPILTGHGLIPYRGEITELMALSNEGEFIEIKGEWEFIDWARRTNLYSVQRVPSNLRSEKKQAILLSGGDTAKLLEADLRSLSVLTLMLARQQRVEGRRLRLDAPRLANYAFLLLEFEIFRETGGREGLNPAFRDDVERYDALADEGLRLKRSGAPPQEIATVVKEMERQYSQFRSHSFTDATKAFAARVEALAAPVLAKAPGASARSLGTELSGEVLRRQLAEDVAILASVKPGDPAAFTFLKRSPRPSGPNLGERSRVAIFPVTANPYHAGHHRGVTALLEKVGVDEVTLVVSPHHRTKKGVSAEELAKRVAVIRAFYRDEPRVSIAVAGSSRYVDLAKSAKQAIGSVQLVLTMGSDAFEVMLDKNGPAALAEIAANISLLASLRREAGKEDPASKITRRLREDPKTPAAWESGQGLSFADLEQGDVSSTMIRVLASELKPEGEYLLREWTGAGYEVLKALDLLPAEVSDKDREKAYASHTPVIDDLLARNLLEHPEKWEMAKRTPGLAEVLELHRKQFGISVWAVVRDFILAGLYWLTRWERLRERYNLVRIYIKAFKAGGWAGWKQEVQLQLADAYFENRYGNARTELIRLVLTSPDGTHSFYPVLTPEEKEEALRILIKVDTVLLRRPILSSIIASLSPDTIALVIAKRMTKVGSQIDPGGAAADGTVEGRTTSLVVLPIYISGGKHDYAHKVWADTMITVNGGDFTIIERVLSHELAETLFKPGAREFRLAVDQSTFQAFLDQHPEIAKEINLSAFFDSGTQARLPLSIARVIYDQRMKSTGVGYLLGPPDKRHQRLREVFLSSYSAETPSEFLMEGLSVYWLDPDLLRARDPVLFDLVDALADWKNLGRSQDTRQEALGSAFPSPSATGSSLGIQLSNLYDSLPFGKLTPDESQWSETQEEVLEREVRGVAVPTADVPKMDERLEFFTRDLDFEAVAERLRTGKVEEAVAMVRRHAHGRLDEWKSGAARDFEALVLELGEAANLVDEIYLDTFEERLRSLLLPETVELLSAAGSEVSDLRDVIRRGVSEAASARIDLALQEEIGQLSPAARERLKDRLADLKRELEGIWGEKRRLAIAVNLEESERGLVIQVLNEFSNFFDRVVVMLPPGGNYQQGSIDRPVSVITLRPGREDESVQSVERSAYGGRLVYLLTMDLGLRTKLKGLGMRSEIGHISDREVSRLAYETSLLALIKATSLLSDEELAKLDARGLEALLGRDDLGLSFREGRDGMFEVLIPAFITHLLAEAREAEAVEKAA